MLPCAQNAVSVCSLNCLCDISSIAPMKFDLASPRGSQGGGVTVEPNGVAIFEGCNIHENTASYVCLHLRTFPELSSIAPVEC